MSVERGRLKILEKEWIIHTLGIHVQPEIYLGGETVTPRIWQTILHGKVQNTEMICTWNYYLCLYLYMDYIRYRVCKCHSETLHWGEISYEQLLVSPGPMSVYLGAGLRTTRHTPKANSDSQSIKQWCTFSKEFGVKHRPRIAKQRKSSVAISIFFM